MSYRLTEYAHSLAEFGSPFWLPHCQGQVLLRTIPGVNDVDATGCYPLFACRQAAFLGKDLRRLKEAGAVTLTLVTDPLGEFDHQELPHVFGAVARPYKAHYLVDLTGDPDRLGTSHHRRNARRCARLATFAVCATPAEHLADWTRLYDHLVARHDITGVARFSRDAFSHQLALPGVLLVRAVDERAQDLGMQFWFTDGHKAWHHLSGYSPAGYRHGGVSYGLMAFALSELKARGVTVADLGAGAGLNADTDDGLSRFKHGWSTHTADAWLCGAVLDAARYEELSGAVATTFFPAYRAPGLVRPSRAREDRHVSVG